MSEILDSNVQLTEKNTSSTLEKAPEATTENKTTVETGATVITPAAETESFDTGNPDTASQTEDIALNVVIEQKQLNDTESDNVTNSEETSTSGDDKEAYSKLSREEIIEQLNKIAESENIGAGKNESEFLKTQFYKLRTIEIDNARKAHIEAGAEAETFIPETDNLEEGFKNAMNLIKERRNQQIKEQEQRQANNLEKKVALLKELSELVEKASQELPPFNEFKELQNRWKEIKFVPQENVADLWKQYQRLVEQFYDVLKLNSEFREYDFKKNLEVKTKLCEASEKLTTESDVISAFRQLQQLHNEFRETGPVAKELREEVWGRFKAASTLINRQHQIHFESKKDKERENLEQKTALCEKIEATDYTTLLTYQAWNAKTEEILALQASWKEIGFAPQKMNLKIFERFRSACDKFFKNKSEFFKNAKTNLNENLEKKKAICEEAEKLKDSTDWKATAESLSQLQKQWKEIGAIPQKFSESLWKRFIGACDYFFEQRNKVNSSQRTTEQENLKLKREVINKLQAIDNESTAQEQEKSLNQLITEWNAIGFVPFKEKDKLYKEYKQIINDIYERLHISENQRKIANFRVSISKGGENLNRERDRLIRQYEAMKNEIATYENNLCFFSTSSKKGESLVTVMKQKMDKLKSDAEIILQKIRLIDDENKG